VKFTSDVSGYVTGIRFYKGAGNTGTHVGHLWSSTGKLLASATFSSETASGWQQANFAQPVAITAKTVYVASYWDPKGHYSVNSGYFTTEYNNAPLHAPVNNGADGSNGLYIYGSSSFPNEGYQATNFWVDVVFTTALSAPTPPQSTSLWSNSTVPAIPSCADPSPHELGVKFTSDVAGTITGIRFYKGSLNTGTHVGHLWTITGTLLATVTFTNETASGWQQATFSQPVAISANTVYVASYWSPNGYHAQTFDYFASEYNNAPLHALADGASGGNGVYLYGVSGFPTTSDDATNYYVDVVFTPAGGGSGSGVTISSISPTSGPVSGGTLTTINGGGFESGASVSFGGANATSVNFVSSTQLTAVTPAGTAGAVGVTVTTPDPGSATLSNGFMYVSNPTLTGVSPSSGPTTGGTTVTISGTGFQSGVIVAFGAMLAASVTVNSSTQIQAVTPAESAGTVSVSITNPDAGKASLASAFTFEASAPPPTPPSSGALLTGCTVSASNQPSCAIPSGWTLVDAQGFESGSLDSDEAFGGSANSITIDTNNAHSGTHSLDTYVTRSYSPWLGMKVKGASVNSRTTYVSFWMYAEQSNPGYGLVYTDWYPFLRNNNVDFWVMLDWQLPGSGPCGTGQKASGWTSLGGCNPANTTFFNNSQGANDAANGAAYFGSSNELLGQWVQYEWYLKVNDPGTDNGVMSVYQNGKLLWTVDNTVSGRCGVFNGKEDCGFMAVNDESQADIYIGGDWGDDVPGNGNATEPMGSTPCVAGTNNIYTPALPVTAQQACPPNGNIPYFHIYIDDVIVLKQ
jgi:hypothetical protein